MTAFSLFDVARYVAQRYPTTVGVHALGAALDELPKDPVIVSRARLAVALDSLGFYAGHRESDDTDVADTLAWMREAVGDFS